MYQDIQIPVPGQNVSASQFGHQVRDSILDLDSRTRVVEVSQQKVVKRGRRITQKTGFNTNGLELPILRLDDVPVISGYMYRISTGAVGVDIDPAATATGEIFTFILRAAFNATAPTPAATITSPSLGRGRNDIINDVEGPIISATAFYYATADGYISVLLSGQRNAGTRALRVYADVNNPMDLTVEFAGEDPGDTGIAL
jgi:hypothetical protein